MAGAFEGLAFDWLITLGHILVLRGRALKSITTGPDHTTRVAGPGREAQPADRTQPSETQLTAQFMQHPQSPRLNPRPHGQVTQAAAVQRVSVGCTRPHGWEAAAWGNQACLEAAGRGEIYFRAGGPLLKSVLAPPCCQVAVSLPLLKVPRWDKRYKVTLSTHPTPQHMGFLVPRQQTSPGLNFLFYKMGLILLASQSQSENSVSECP